jgi:formylglycine-generating enzyme required for sulfatase activity
MNAKYISKSALVVSVVLIMLACTLGQTPPGLSATQVPVAVPVTGLTPVGQEPAAEEQHNLPGPLPEPGDTLPWVDGSLLVYIPPGEFIMGNNGEDNPEHMVYLDGFWIYRTEVTNRMYLRCMAMGECSPPAADPSLPNLEDLKVADHPIVGVRWNQAKRYCQFVGGYLPTEAQWEKTARGPDGNTYPWGNAEPNCELLNYNHCLGETSRVIDYPPGASPYEVLDMAGNVFEWVADWYQANYYAEAHYDNPPGPEHGEVRSIRGSTFNAGPDQIASALRTFLSPEEYRPDLGFRCVVANAQEFAPPCEVLAHVSPDATGQPGEAPGGSASCIVQQPQLDVVTYCDKKVRGNNISWTPADADIDYSSHEGVSCSQYDADTLACAGPPGSSVFIKACKSCPPPVVELGVMGTCDPPYILDESAGLCRYAGPPAPGANLCAPGFSLLTLPDTVCCEMQQGTVFDYPACAPGGSYDSTSRICWYRLPSMGDEKCTSETVHFSTCERPGGGGSGSGDPGDPDDPADPGDPGDPGLCSPNCIFLGNQCICP